MLQDVSAKRNRVLVDSSWQSLFAFQLKPLNVENPSIIITDLTSLDHASREPTSSIPCSYLAVSHWMLSPQMVLSVAATRLSHSRLLGTTNISGYAPTTMQLTCAT
jgi:hypothetical protein